MTPWLLAALLSQTPTEVKPQPMSSYGLGPASIEGAKLTVGRLLHAARDQDDVAYDKVAKGMVIMLAPDFAFPLDRAKFQEAFAACTTPTVASSRPLPKMPEAQAVRIMMTCTDKDHPKPVNAIADIMADDEHTFMIFPGGVEAVWPDKVAE
jgi:hypothetical protein